MANVKVISHLLRPDGDIPNHPRWPLLVYPKAVELSAPDPAVVFEELFAHNRWTGSWRNGIYGFHHYHSNAHEVLGIYSGEATVQFGGEGGVTVTARPGDVIVLPAGTGHKKLRSSGRLGVVGAYPAGHHPDVHTAERAGAKDAAQVVAAVPLPECDPVYGPRGPLFDHWRK